MPTLKAAIDAREAKTGARDFEKAAKDIERGAGRVTKDSEGLNKTLDNTGKTASNLGGILRKVAVSMSAMYIMRDLVSVASGFEQTMAELKGVTSATDTQMRLFTETARELGATTIFSAKQAGEGLVFLSRAGFSTAQAISALPATLDLAVAATMDLGRASDIASNILSAFRIPAENTSRVVDTLANTANRANTDVELLAQGMKFVGPIASSLGISLEETSASIGVLSDAGIQGALAGTSLRSVLATLLKPTTDATKQLRAMGLTLDDVNPSIHSVTEIMRTLNKAGLDTASAVNIFGRRVASTALVLAEGADKVEELARANVEAEGSARKMAEIMGDTLQGRLKGLRSAVEELFLQTGEAGLVGTLKDLVSVATSVVRMIGGSTEAMQNASTATKVFVGLVRLTIGGIRGLWEIVSTVFSNIFGMIQEVAQRWGMDLGGAVSDFFESLVDGTIAIKDLANGFIANIKKISAYFQAFFIEPFITGITGIKEIWEGVGQFLAVAWRNPIGAVAMMFTNMLTTVLDAVGTILYALEGVARSSGQESIAVGFARMMEQVDTSAHNLEQAGKKFAGDSAEEIQKALDTIGGGMTKAITGLVIPTIGDLEARIASFSEKNAQINEDLLFQVENRIARELEAEKKKQEELARLQTGDTLPTLADIDPEAQDQQFGMSDAQVTTALDQLRKYFMSELELLETHHQERLNLLQYALETEMLQQHEYDELMLQVHEDFEKRKTEIESEQMAERRRLRLLEWQTGLTMAQQGLQSIQNLLIASGNKNLAESKAFGVAQAVVSTAIGIARAMELGWPAAIPAMALAASTGAAQIAAITSASKGSSSPPTIGTATPDISGTAPNTSSPEQVQDIIVQGSSIDVDELAEVLSEMEERGISLGKVRRG